MKKIQRAGLSPILLRKFYLLVIAITVCCAGCRKEDPPKATEDEVASSDEAMAMARGVTHTIVHSGASIQAAVDAATRAMIIFIEPGLYKEAITVNKPGIQLIGLPGLKKKVVIENPGEEEYGIRVNDAGDGFVLKNVTVQNFEEYGVFLVRVDNFILEHVISINNSEYGLFPVVCSHGSIRFCSATGSSDTGIYVGQSSDVVVEYNVAFANVSGIEIENCTNVRASWNDSYGNTAGLLVFLLPGLTIKTSSNIMVNNNNIHDNNLKNFAPEGNGFEVFIPQGAGMLVVGADNVTIKQNIVRNNNFVGIATVSTLVLGALAGIPPEGFSDIEPNPDGVRIIQNLVKQNGAAPPAGLPLPAADLLWDGSGTNNCWAGNAFATSFPSPLPACN